MIAIWREYTMVTMIAVLLILVALLYIDITALTYRAHLLLLIHQRVTKNPLRFLAVFRSQCPLAWQAVFAM